MVDGKGGMVEDPIGLHGCLIVVYFSAMFKSFLTEAVSNLVESQGLDLVGQGLHPS